MGYQFCKYLIKCITSKTKSCARHESGFKKMAKKFILAIAIIASVAIADNVAPELGITANTCYAAAPNNGTYSKTGYSVNVYTQEGHSKGSFAVYLHNGQRYIDFKNTWICIQGRSRFSYCGNWYVIR